MTSLTPEPEFSLSPAGRRRLDAHLERLAGRAPRARSSLTHDPQPWGWVTYGVAPPTRTPHMVPRAVHVYRPGLSTLARSEAHAFATAVQPVPHDRTCPADQISWLVTVAAALAVFVISGPWVGVLAAVAFQIAQALLIRHLRGRTSPDVRSIAASDPHFTALTQIDRLLTDLRPHLDRRIKAFDPVGVMWAAAANPHNAAEILDRLRQFAAAAADQQAAEDDQRRILRAERGDGGPGSRATLSILDALTAAGQAVYEDAESTRRSTAYLTSTDDTRP